MDIANIKVEPMSATWGEDTYQVETIQCVADSSDSLDGTYFFMTLPDGTRHHFWFNTSGGSATDPAPGGSTAQVVAITTGATAAAVATALEAVIEAVSGLNSEVSGSTVTVTHSNYGYAQPAVDGGAPTGFTFAVTTEGDTALDLGHLDGDLELMVAEDLLDVTSQQRGTNVLSQIRTGKQVEVTLNLQETAIAQLKKMFRAPGGSLTPAGAGGTEVVGMGTYKDFTQTYNQAKKLYLHPAALSASDKTRDYTFHKAYPILDSIAFSGENKLTVPVTFKCYPKESLNNRVEYFAFGDGSQTLT